MIKRLILLPIFLMLLSWPAKSQNLIADLSDHSITITPQFSGTEVLLFGSIQTPGDIIVVITGPLQREVVRKKENLFGFWLNTESVAFDKVPGFYQIYASKDILDIISEQVRKRYNIGHDLIQLKAESQSAADRSNIKEFKKALTILKRENNLFSDEPQRIYFRGKNLFRAFINIPAHVPNGQYNVNVYLFQDGTLIDGVTTPLIVQKVGVEATLYDLAHENGTLYGLLCVFMALIFGWFSSYIFRKD